MVDVILQNMKGIDPKLMLRIWRELLLLERSSDFELATRAKISHGNINNWQSPTAPKYVRLSTLRQIEQNLGYHIEVTEKGDYKIEKIHPLNEIKESRSLYGRAHLSETEGGLSSEDVKLLDDLSSQLSQIAKQIDQIKNRKK